MKTPALVLSAVLLAGCSAGAETVAAPPDPAPTSPAPSVRASPGPTVRVIEASYAGGKVTVISSRVETVLGEEVVLRFTSDVVEEVHVHGYDQYVALAPGTTTDVPLTLTLPGSYEVELHLVGRPLYQLRTR